MAKEYLVNEGNKIGYMDSSFGSDLTLNQKKLIADGDLTKGQVVYISGDMKVKATTAATKAVIGVAMFDAKNGEDIAVECEGLFKLTAGGTIAAGAEVEAAAGGKVATASGSPTKVIGIALSGASAGEDVYVKFSI